MKQKILSLMIVLALLASLPTQALAAESGTCGEGITWTYENGVMTISGEGKMADFPSGTPWDAYKSSITSVVFTGGVTYVGAGSFKDCDSLTSVSFGSSMYELGADSFNSCDALSALSMPASFKVFGARSLQSCPSLKRIDCAGRFPTFRENCLWATYTNIYYPVSNPWPVDTIKELESAFHGRVEFLCADGTDPVKPEEPKPTTPPATQPPVETTASTESATTPTFTLPTVTTPAFTVPQQDPVPTLAVDYEDDADDNTTLWLVLLLLLSLGAATAAFIIHNRQLQRRRRQRRRRPPQ